MQNKLYKKIRNIVEVFFVIAFFSLPNTSSAASLYISPSVSNVSVGNIVTLKVVVNTEEVNINNAEGVIQYPTDLLEVISINKSPSVFSLWVEEPSFSNGSGKVTFNGGVANPGYNGSSGTIASIVFKAKKQGQASILFSDGAVRKNDGLGTDVLGSKMSATVIIKDTKVDEVPNVNKVDNSTSILKPLITSDTHPNQELWYSNNTASFSWKIPSSVTSVKTLINRNPNSVPTITYDNSVTQKTLNNLSDGTFYFHLGFSNATSASPIANYRVNIDTTAPSQFTPTIRVVDGHAVITLNAKDNTSGIDYYLLKIDQDSEIKVKTSDLLKSEYSLPVLNEGNHNITVIAYDKAGNNTNSSTSFTAPSILVPVISLSAKEITENESVIISGESGYPSESVEIKLILNGKEIKKYTQIVSSDGTFYLNTDNISDTGLISISAQNVLSSKARSLPSKNIYLKVNESGYIKITRTIIWISIICILLMLLLIALYIGWHKFFSLKKKIDRELELTIKEVHKSTLLLKEELIDQLESLEKVKQDRELNKKEQAIFDDIQENIDAVDVFIEKKLKKLM